MTTYAHAHSGSFITGSPKAGEDMFAWADEFDAVFQRALDAALIFARKDLRLSAEQNEAWKGYAPLLDVVFDGDSFVYVMNGDDEQNQAMHELEYGGDNVAPNSLLRKVAIRQPGFIGQIMTDALSGTVPVA